MISYQREKDAIFYITEQYEQNPAITTISHRNFHRIDNFPTFFTASPGIGRWFPQLTIGIQKQCAKVEHNGETLSMNKPMIFGTFNNNIELPYQWTLSVDMTFQSKGDCQSEEMKSKNTK